MKTWLRTICQYSLNIRRIVLQLLDFMVPESNPSSSRTVKAIMINVYQPAEFSRASQSHHLKAGDWHPRNEDQTGHSL